MIIISLRMVLFNMGQAFGQAMGQATDVALFAVIGVGAYYLWKYFGGSLPDVPTPCTKDEHGCCTEHESWCGSLGHCVEAGLTCPPDWHYIPILPPDYDAHGCRLDTQSWCSDLSMCLSNDLMHLCDQHKDHHDEEDHGRFSDKCSRNGNVVSVPVGMNCEDALNEMCNRGRTEFC